MAEEDNKMWEGHRIIYPNLRNKYLELQTPSYSRPLWDEQHLEFLEHQLNRALILKNWITLTISSPQGPLKKEVLAIKIEKCLETRGFVLKCSNTAGNIIKICLADIVDIICE